MKKRLLTIMLITGMSLSMIACGTEEKEENVGATSVLVEEESIEEAAILIEETEKDVLSEQKVLDETYTVEEVVEEFVEEFEEVKQNKIDESSFITEKESLNFDIPEEFEKNDTSVAILYQKPGVSSNINVVKSVNDGSLDSITGAAMIAAIETELESVYGEDLTLTLIDGELTEVDGHKAFRYSYDYEIQGIYILQTQFIVENGDEYEYITFSDCNDGYTDIFEECMEGIEYLNNSEL